MVSERFRCPVLLGKQLIHSLNCLFNRAGFKLRVEKQSTTFTLASHQQINQNSKQVHHIDTKRGKSHHKNSFSIVGAKIWNSIPESYRKLLQKENSSITNCNFRNSGQLC